MQHCIDHFFRGPTPFRATLDYIFTTSTIEAVLRLQQNWWRWWWSWYGSDTSSGDGDQVLLSSSFWAPRWFRFCLCRKCLRGIQFCPLQRCLAAKLWRSFPGHFSRVTFLSSTLNHTYLYMGFVLRGVWVEWLGSADEVKLLRQPSDHVLLAADLAL